MLTLREVTKGDLEIFFTQQLDAESNRMAAFTVEDPFDRDAFDEHWARIFGDDTIVKRTIVDDERVAGYISTFQREGDREISYWIGKAHWGNGIASKALAAILTEVSERPLHARAAKDNVASIRVLEKCGFENIGDDRAYSNARGEDVEEFIFVLNGHDDRTP
jgi:RimJ/RimL family protein N-acetyltransferase